MRKLLLKIHLYLALVAGFFILIVALTGAALVFEEEIDHALNAKTWYVTPQGAPLPLETIVARIHAAFPNRKISAILIAQRPDLAQRVMMQDKGDIFVDSYTGAMLGTRDMSKGDLGHGFARTIHLIHTRLMAGTAGEYFVGAITVITLFILVSGLYLWWGRKILTVRRGASWKRINFDLHNVFGFYAAVFLVYVALSGIIISFEGYTDTFLKKKLNAHPETDPPSHSTVVEGATRISLDEAIRAAEGALPGATPTIISVPSKPEEMFRISKRFPEDRAGAGRSRVFIDQYSGKVLYIKSTRMDELGTSIVNIKRAVHTGDLFGWPTRIIAFVSCLFLVGQLITGVLIWWKKIQVSTGISSSQ